MVLVDFKQQHVIGTQIDPLLQRVQELIPISPEYMICLMISLPQQIAPLVA